MGAEKSGNYRRLSRTNLQTRTDEPQQKTPNLDIHQHSELRDCLERDSMRTLPREAVSYVVHNPKIGC